MTIFRLLRYAIFVGLAVTVAAVILEPGLASGAALLAFLGWSRENALRQVLVAQVHQAATELEIAGARSNALQERLDDAIILVPDTLGKSPSKAVH